MCDTVTQIRFPGYIGSNSSGPYTELSKLEIARRHVTDLDRFKYRKKLPPDITKLGTE